ncbi:MAG TPA: glutamate--tRNA ligase family protein [Longimicrobiaceae bacterium]|nr:glutamate--tRNA ligase family protein [Longimicrobiaceae bacterium]
MTVRTRFAPSPTGNLHVGGARTAILNWLLARHTNGTFVLRIEDTDTDRNREGADAEILEDLRWLGLDWDEGPGMGGQFGPYRQSERFDIYRTAAEQLLEAGHAYFCTCPPVTSEPGTRRERCACAGRKIIPGSPPPAASVRFLVAPRGDILVDDMVRGEISFPADSIEDFVILRTDGRPTYNFAAAVDDAAMRITHVVRGADHLGNTPKQLLLFDAFAWDPPRFAHIPLILGEDRQKLSKRHGATSVSEHRRLGYLPEALVNYLSLLSWSSPTGDEFLPAERLIREIDMDRIGVSDAIFDRDKLEWLSHRYMQELPLPDIVDRVRPFVSERFAFANDRLPAAIAAVRDRMSLLSQVDEHLTAFAGPQTVEQTAARDEVLADAEARRVLGAVRAGLADISDWDEEAINGAIREAGKAAGARGRALFHPLRVALTGEERGLELVKIVYVLGRDRALGLLSAEGREV